MTNARVRFRLVFTQPHHLGNGQAAFEPVTNGVQETFCTALEYVRRVAWPVRGRPFEYRMALRTGLVAVQSNNILHLTAENVPMNASHIEF